jgi:hypothetical protein
VATLKQELSRSDGAYESEPRKQADVLTEHREFLEPMKLMGSLSLPYLYWSPKFHKQPTGQRYIAGSGKCSTVKCSKVLSDVLTQVMRTLRAKDNDNIRKTGIRRYFTVESFEEVTQFLGKWRRVGRCRKMYTGDFSTMYTTIPHADLARAVRAACNEAFAWQAQQQRVPAQEMRLNWTKDGVDWHTSKRAGSTHAHDRHSFDVEGIVVLVEFLVANTYLVNGNTIKRQKLGIPMGTNCAPVLANLYLYVYESEFIDKISAISTANARQFHLTFRFIDDLLCLDNPHWASSVEKSAADGGVYPSVLKLSDTSVSDNESHFLGLHIRAVASRFRVSVFDKRQTFPFEVRRYPRTDSLIPRTIPYGVFIGQLHRGYRICSDWHDFVTHAVQVAQRLVTNGCTQQRLSKIFRAFVRATVRKYSVTSLSLGKTFSRELGS